MNATLSESDTIHIGYLGSCKKTETKLMKWGEKKPVHKGRQRGYNVPGVKGQQQNQQILPGKLLSCSFRKNCLELW